MIDDILKAIDEKAEEQIAKILKEKEESFLALENDYDLATRKKQREQRDLALKRTTKEIEDFEKMLQIRLNFKMQEEKNRLIKEIYHEAEEKVTCLGETEFKKLIKYLASYLPHGKKGHISAGEKTAKVLRSFVDSEIRVENDLNEEGFIFKSHDVEIDLRISQAFSQLREAVNPELIKILFS
ncbi:hypothetical protein COZ78_02145 [bacterium (Candidatus Gribaldobacteria) CG_4_8_14_3_um_filter_42_11]|uniref:V-type ATP synthase subunit E n=1 Tax=bacterium (Candidatus Gribaldobacteria) CG_4_8_14_3_um_filter_42_11 TaxID=2014267 RepID=A0A2M7IY52_9BACT|nr:MAG: hypothetical protein AUJ36_02840 [Parcubacteria group bacterium CG1_02_41_26]PIX03100.1 MAG: hypothetical protein COZ78_02145 [bacterium (Candidatus Gribaldobacteria) CG_4_8_14_3_um_filter_42_11]